jgi:hypothetical protein
MASARILTTTTAYGIISVHPVPILTGFFIAVKPNTLGVKAPNRDSFLTGIAVQGGLGALYLGLLHFKFIHLLTINYGVMQ